MKNGFLKKFGTAVVGISAAAGFWLVTARARSGGEKQFDAAKTFKTKCFFCHGARAGKRFDATRSDDQLIQILLNGKRMKKPPNMPAFEKRGITADDAKALVAYMKSLRQ